MEAAKEEDVDSLTGEEDNYRLTMSSTITKRTRTRSSWTECINFKKISSCNAAVPEINNEKKWDINAARKASWELVKPLRDHHEKRFTFPPGITTSTKEAKTVAKKNQSEEIGFEGELRNVLENKKKTIFRSVESLTTTSAIRMMHKTNFLQLFSSSSSSSRRRKETIFGERNLWESLRRVHAHRMSGGAFLSLLRNSP